MLTFDIQQGRFELCSPLQLDLLSGEQPPGNVCDKDTG